MNDFYKGILVGIVAIMCVAFAIWKIVISRRHCCQFCKQHGKRSRTKKSVYTHQLPQENHSPPGLRRVIQYVFRKCLNCGRVDRVEKVYHLPQNRLDKIPKENRIQLGRSEVRRFFDATGGSHPYDIDPDMHVKRPVSSIITISSQKNGVPNHPHLDSVIAGPLLPKRTK